MKQALLISTLLGLSAMSLSGCANSFGRAGMLTSGTGSSSTATSTAVFTTTNSTNPSVCNVAQNVVPANFYDNGTTAGSYSVCPGTTAPQTDIILVGSSKNGGNSICVFPVLLNDPTVTSAYIADPTNSNLPLFKCSTLTSGVAYASFTNTKYNAMYVVDNITDPSTGESYVQEMEKCLLKGSSLTCPPYSHSTTTYR